MNNDQTASILALGFAWGLAIGAIIMILALRVNDDHANDVWQKDAVSHHKAEFYIDSDSNKKWRWLP